MLAEGIEPTFAELWVRSIHQIAKRASSFFVNFDDFTIRYHHGSKFAICDTYSFSIFNPGKEFVKVLLPLLYCVKFHNSNVETPEAGFEPATKRLTVVRSAAELLGNIVIDAFDTQF